MIRRFTLVTCDKGRMMTAHRESQLVSRVEGAGHETTTRGERLPSRRVDLDFSILEIEMMRHDRCAHARYVTQLDQRTNGAGRWERALRESGATRSEHEKWRRANIICSDECLRSCGREKDHRGESHSQRKRKERLE